MTENPQLTLHNIQLQKSYFRTPLEHAQSVRKREELKNLRYIQYQQKDLLFITFYQTLTLLPHNLHVSIKHVNVVRNYFVTLQYLSITQNCDLNKTLNFAKYGIQILLDLLTKLIVYFTVKIIIYIIIDYYSRIITRFIQNK